MTYHFRIRTASGGILNTSQWGRDIENAKYRLLKRYPGATIIDCTETTRPRMAHLPEIFP